MEKAQLDYNCNYIPLAQVSIHCKSMNEFIAFIANQKIRKHDLQAMER